MLLTGSQALRYHLKEPFSDKSDYDIICHESELPDGLAFNDKYSVKFGNIEFINIYSLNNYVFEDMSVHNIDITIDGKEYPVSVCNLNDLYIQKRSHAHRPIKFAKNIFDLKKLKELGVKLSLHDSYLLHKRTKKTKKLFKDNVPSLNQTNEDFFDDAVKKFYVHDHIHEVMAYYDKPLYSRMKRDFSLAKCEKDLWEEFSHEDKIRCVREECYVIGVERFLVPHLEFKTKSIPEKLAFSKALEKVCTTLTSGWFRDFAIDNFFEILNYDVKFYDKFYNAINTGELKKCN